MGELVHPEVEIHTARTVHRGREAAMDWAAKSYDHLVRRYEPSELDQRDDEVVVTGEVQYVWRESGEVGDSAPVEITLGLRDGLISSWRLRDL